MLCPHQVAHNHCNFSSRGIQFLWPLKAPAGRDPHPHTDTRIIKNNKKKSSTPCPSRWYLPAMSCRSFGARSLLFLIRSAYLTELHCGLILVFNLACIYARREFRGQGTDIVLHVSLGEGCISSKRDQQGCSCRLRADKNLEVPAF